MSLNSTANMKSHFSSNAAGYEKLTGGTTRRIAEACLPLLPPLTSSSRILDSACGPGIVTGLILDSAHEQGVNPPPHITAIDFAPGMIAQLEARKSELGWRSVESRLLDAQQLDGLADNSFDAVIMNFGILALPSAEAGAREIHRVLRPGGAAVVTTWKRSGAVDVLQRVVGAIRPEDRQKVFPVSEEWFKAEKLRSTMVLGGFDESKVHVREEATSWRGNSTEELVDALSGPHWQRIWEDWTEEEKERWRSEMERQLSEEERKSASLEMIAWICVADKE